MSNCALRAVLLSVRSAAKHPRKTLCDGSSYPLYRHQVDLLQHITPGIRRGRRRQEQENTPEDVEEEEEVASLRLVGLGMQLHSKSHGARFSFSMQDLDLEVQ